MDVLDKYFGVHGDALALRSKRLEMLASNIANAATPGFKARDIDFAAELKRAEGGGAGLQATSVAHIAEGTPGFGGDALYRIPVKSSLDGNTVELSVEQTKLGENAVPYQNKLSSLNGRTKTQMRALRGEKPSPALRQSTFPQ